MEYDIIHNFLETEVKQGNSPGDAGMYFAIVDFLTSDEIRKGEFEANEFILTKMDREMVLIYAEYETPKGIIRSKDAKIVAIEELLNLMRAMANSIGIHQDK